MFGKRSSYDGMTVAIIERGKRARSRSLGEKMNTISKYKVWIGGALSLVVIALIIGAIYPKHAAGAPPGAMPDVEVAQVEQKDVPIFGEWIGTLDGYPYSQALKNLEIVWTPETLGKLFELESVQIKVDDKLVASYLYTPLEVQALHRGGVQRVYLGNLRAGEHELVAFFTGRGPHERDYKRGTTIRFDKGTEPKYIELRIRDSTGKLQPEFDVKVWQ